MFELNGRPRNGFSRMTDSVRLLYGLEKLLLLIVLTMLADGQTSLKDLRFLPELLVNLPVRVPT